MRALVPLLVASLVLDVSPARAQDVGAHLDSVMRAAAAQGFTGAVRVDRDGRTLLERGYGQADRAKGIAFTPATVVQIGSNTKDFTAVAILQLHERGRLSIDDPIGKYFPSAPADRRAVTIRQLLTHRAGYPAGLGGDFEPVSRQALIDSAMHVRLLFVPGARESYSNTGYSLLAAIVEQVTGVSYDVYVRDAILTPLGLTRTGFLLPGFGPDDLAHGYLSAGTDAGTMLAKPHAADGPWWNLRGNGGMLSTVGEMHAFYDTLFTTTRLLSADTRRIMFNADVPIGLAGSDGVNFFLYERVPAAKLTLIVASTNATAKAPAIRRELARVLGLPDAGGGDDRVARRPGGRPAPAALAAQLTALVRTIDAADTAAIRRFVRERFADDPGAPSVDERVARLGGLHERLGTLTITRIETFDDGPAEVTLSASVVGETVIRVMVDREAPYKIHGLQVQVVGG